MKLLEPGTPVAHVVTNNGPWFGVVSEARPGIGYRLLLYNPVRKEIERWAWVSSTRAVSEDQVPDEIWAALAKWRLTQ